MPNYRVPGTRSAAPASSTQHKIDYLGVGLQPYLATRVDAARGGSESVESPATKDDDVIKISLDGGIELWTNVKQAREDYGGIEAARGGGENLIVPRVLPIGRGDRGAGSWIVKGLDLFKVDIADVAASKIVEALEKNFEDKLGIGGPGLYRFDKDAKPQAEKDFKKAMTGGPSLVFIHGTASCSEAGFGKMRDRPAWSELFAQYKNRVFAFEHRTLSENPIQNAIELATALPDGAEIDLISHSRGGLVAKLICRSARVDENGNTTPAFDDMDSMIYEKVRRDSDVKGAEAIVKEELKQLKELNAVLAKKRLRIRHLVRAGCPARGTTLASRRLDRYLSLIVSAMKMIPGLTANPVFDLTMALLLAVAKKRTDPEDVPGLEAQMPESPLIRIVNRADINLSNRLSVISGDIEGGGILGRLKILATDLFYLEDHDLVVNTSAMYGGARRRASAAAMFDQGSAVNHFSYFSNERTAKGIIDALNLRLAEKEGFKPLEDFTRAPARSRAAIVARSGPAPVVYVLPGSMGTQLESDKKLIWFKLLRIVGGAIDKIAWGEPVTTDGIFTDYYADLVEFLSATHEVIPFDYDWRKSLLTESARFAATVEKKMKDTSQPIRFVAHSMGGLVVRALAAQKPDLWKRIMNNPGARFVMLGTPNMGSFSIVSTLLGRDKTIKQLELVDIKHSMKELLQIVSAYPGVLELLPRDKSGELYEAAIWTKIRANDSGKWIVPADLALASADAAWKKIEGFSLTGSNLAYVAGFNKELTPSAIRFDAGKKVTILGTKQGDGRVPWATGILPGMPVWYADAAHGDLARFRSAFPAYLDLLSTGQTTKLPTSPPAASRAAITELEEVKDARIEIFPTERDATDAIMGAGSPLEAAAAPAGKIKMRVAHGNLAFASHTVAVGHYDGDTIRGAEASLDRHLNERLSRKRKLGLYPGKLDTAEFIRDDDGKPPGALIIGLGQFGDLSPGGLRRTYAHALKKFADISTDGKQDVTSLSISTLLIGHRESRLTLRDSVSAMMDGLIHARDELAEIKGTADFTEVEIVELYEDTAIAALRILRDLSKDKRISDNLDIEKSLGTLGGKLKRIAPSDESEWARKIQIRGKDENGNRGSLVFTVLTGSARATEIALATQGALIDPYLQSLTASSAMNADVSETLFELLTPKEFKAQASEDRDVVLILDEAAAAYPWELLDDRFGSGSEPMVVRSSCIRHLIDAQTEFRSALSTERRAVVIGDSINDPSGDFQELPGARREAEAVASILRSSSEGIKVEDVIGGSCAKITDALLRTGARIMHIAAHGVYEYERNTSEGQKEKVTGMVLGDGAFFTAQEANQIRPFPELVFLNCCFLGKIAPQKDKDLKLWNDRHRLASNLAHQFIRNGAKAVVAAGWAVDDAAAETFATEFYSAMLSGNTFSESVKSARKATYVGHPACNTWGAYQCYGDPDYLLFERAPGGTGREPELLSAAEAAIEIDNLNERSSTASEKKLEESQQAIEKLLLRIGPQWLQRSSIQEGFAKAYANADLFDKALETYAKAIAGSDAGSSLKAVEQLANLRARQAAFDLRAMKGKATPKARKKAAQGIRTAIRQLEELNKVIKRSSSADVATVERLSLIASAMKRLGAVETGLKRSEALGKAAKLYEDAYAIAIRPESGQTNAYYPALNALVLRGLENLTGKQAPMSEKEADQLKAIRDNADREDRRSPDFYALAARTDALIAECIWQGTFAGRADEIVASFKAAWKRGGSHLQRRAVLEQLDFIADCLDGIKTASNEELSQSVRAVREQIERASDD